MVSRPRVRALVALAVLLVGCKSNKGVDDVATAAPGVDSGIATTAEPAPGPPALQPLAIPVEPVRIGYFFGGRTHAVYRAYINGYFEREQVDVLLYTKYLGGEDWPVVPRNHREVRELQKLRRVKGALSRTWGKVTGVKIIDAMLAGEFQAGTPGESSFVERVVQGVPIVAVAMLGFEDRELPGKAIVVRTGVKIDKPTDFRGKTFITRRAGAGDAMLLREFLADIGIRPDEVKIIDQVHGPDQRTLLASGKADAALLHMHGIPYAEKEGFVYMYRKFDWMDPNLSHALLVFRRDYVEQHREQVKRVVRAYMKRVKYESALPLEEKLRKRKFGLQIIERYKNLMIPIFEYPTPVRVDLLEGIQRLLLKHKFINQTVDMHDYVDNSIVEEIVAELD